MKLISFTILILAAACSTMKESPADTTKNQIPMVPTIIFLNYKIEKNLDAHIEIQLVNTIQVDGELKESGQKTPDFGARDLKCIQMNDRSARLDSVYISDPLERDIEYQDSDGVLGRKHIELDSAEFSVRMQLHPQTQYILIEKADQPDNQLLKTKL